MYVASEKDRVRQGSVFKDFLIKDAYDTTNEVSYDFIIVLSQDCDLDQHYDAIEGIKKTEQPDYVPHTDPHQRPNHDKYIQTVLICPAFNADKVKDGKHMATFNMTMQYMSTKSGMWGSVKSNQYSRYYCLELCEDFGLPALILDFKRTYTVPIEHLEKFVGKEVARLDDIYASAVTLKYGAYVSRIALPEDKDS